MTLEEKMEKVAAVVDSWRSMQGLNIPDHDQRALARVKDAVVPPLSDEQIEYAAIYVWSIKAGCSPSREAFMALPQGERDEWILAAKALIVAVRIGVTVPS